MRSIIRQSITTLDSTGALEGLRESGNEQSVRALFDDGVCKWIRLDNTVIYRNLRRPNRLYVWILSPKLSLPNDAPVDPKLRALLLCRYCRLVFWERSTDTLVVQVVQTGAFEILYVGSGPPGPHDGGVHYLLVSDGTFASRDTSPLSTTTADAFRSPFRRPPGRPYGEKPQPPSILPKWSIFP